ncbi:MAG: hypothetical protein SFV18_07515 [Bryobacteraceae bacterium]|nr:hypothetical protein [Bryobacteraceae bacterium]
MLSSLLFSILVAIDPPSADAQLLAKRLKYERAFAGANVKDPAARIYFFPDDAAFPQVAIGGGWTTTFYITNLGTATETADLDFWTGSGGLWQASFQGTRADRISLRIGPGQTAVLQSDNPSTLETGWATLFNDNSSSANVVGVAVFRQRVTGRPDFEAGVPLTGLFDRRFVLQFDNTQGYVTSVALAAGVTSVSTTSTAVSVTVRDENGNTLATHALSLPAFGHTAFALSDRFPSTANRRGSIVFTSSTDSLSALGLRFTPGGAFTTMPILTNAALQR